MFCKFNHSILVQIIYINQNLIGIMHSTKVIINIISKWFTLLLIVLAISEKINTYSFETKKTE